jgi:FixJ family two-component response regulator
MADAGIIVIIDDDASVRSATGGLLRSLGYSVAMFASAHEFLRSNLIQQTSCVITDIRMPGLSGVELQDFLAAKGHKVPMIFMTAFPDRSTEKQVRSKGAHGFLTKPYQAESLIDCVTSALRAGA